MPHQAKPQPAAYQNVASVIVAFVAVAQHGGFSAAAKEKIEKAGGTAEVVSA